MNAFLQSGSSPPRTSRIEMMPQDNSASARTIRTRSTFKPSAQTKSADGIRLSASTQRADAGGAAQKHSATRQARPKP